MIRRSSNLPHMQGAPNVFREGSPRFLGAATLHTSSKCKYYNKITWKNMNFSLSIIMKKDKPSAICMYV